LSEQEQDGPARQTVAVPSLGCFSGTTGSIAFRLQAPHGALVLAWSRAGYSGTVRRPDCIAAQYVLCSQGVSVLARELATAIVRSFYAGEAGKLILTAVLFALTFAGVKPLAPLAYFGVTSC
jgi:hypothetical protein